MFADEYVTGFRVCKEYDDVRAGGIELCFSNGMSYNAGCYESSAYLSPLVSLQSDEFITTVEIGFKIEIIGSLSYEGIFSFRFETNFAVYGEYGESINAWFNDYYTSTGLRLAGIVGRSGTVLEYVTFVWDVCDIASTINPIATTMSNVETTPMKQSTVRSHTTILEDIRTTSEPHSTLAFEGSTDSCELHYTCMLSYLSYEIYVND